MSIMKKLIFLILLMTFAVNGGLFAQKDILAVAEKLPRLEGKVPVYYPAGYKNTAISLQALLQKAIEYYQRELNINIPVGLVLFTAEEDANRG